MKRRIIIALAGMAVIVALAIVVSIIMQETDHTVEHNVTRDAFVESVVGEKDNSREYIKDSSDPNNGLKEEHSYNLRDIFTYLALIFTVIAVVVFWVLHTIRARRDPLRKWLR